MSEREKKFTYILVALAVVAIIIVILVNVPLGGDKARIRREFGNLEKEHVFETITYDEVFEKINSGETFQLFVGSSFTVNDKSFAYEADKLAKEYNLETIYYLRLYELTETQITDLKVETSSYVVFDTLHWTERTKDERQEIPQYVFKLADKLIERKVKNE